MKYFMKNSENKKNMQFEKKTLQVSVSLLEQNMMVNIIERIVDKQYNNNYPFQKIQPNWNTIQTTSIEAYANGDISISSEMESIDMYFVSSFIFTCIKDRDSKNMISWSSSLS